LSRNDLSAVALAQAEAKTQKDRFSFLVGRMAAVFLDPL